MRIKMPFFRQTVDRHLAKSSLILSFGIFLIISLCGCDNGNNSYEECLRINGLAKAQTNYAAAAIINNCQAQYSQKTPATPDPRKQEAPYDVEQNLSGTASVNAPAKQIQGIIINNSNWNITEYQITLSLVDRITGHAYRTQAFQYTYDGDGIEPCGRGSFNTDIDDFSLTTSDYSLDDLTEPINYSNLSVSSWSITGVFGYPSNATITCKN